MTAFILDILGLLAVSAAVIVITAQSPVVSVIWLIAVFIVSACYLILLGVTFVGLSYLVVYVGAVAVLFLFVVMILNVRISEIVAGGQEFTKGLPLGFAVSLIFIYEILKVINLQGTYSDGTLAVNTTKQAGEFALNIVNYLNSYFIKTSNFSETILGGDVFINFTFSAADTGFIEITQVQALGLSLYTYNVITFMLVSIVLLLSMIGPISLCLKGPRV